MRTIKILFLSAVLCCCYPADDMLMLIERDSAVDVSLLLVDDDSTMFQDNKYVPGKDVKKKILLKNCRIELERHIRNDTYVPRNIRKQAVLGKEKGRRFFDDINKMKLVTIDDVFVLCYEVYIYDQGKLITGFRTDGYHFYDRKNKIMYYSQEDLLNKYWGVLEENHCR